MGKRVAVQLDLERIRANLAKEDRRPFTEAEVQRWLIDAGFEPAAGRWLVKEKDLGQLDPSEVLSIEDSDE
jgi:hypothetical protein